MVTIASLILMVLISLVFVGIGIHLQTAWWMGLGGVGLVLTWLVAGMIAVVHGNKPKLDVPPFAMALDGQAKARLTTALQEMHKRRSSHK